MDFLPPVLWFFQDLKVPSGQIGFAWEWYHWIGLTKFINRYRFFIFFIFILIYEKTSKFWAASYKNESNLLLVWITVCMYTNRDLFPPNRSSKCGECQQLFFGLRLVSRIFEEFQHPAIQTKEVQHFGRFFDQIKVCRPIGRKDSIKTVIRWIHFCMKQLRTLKSF
jgi:hypothetical protein